MKTQTIEQPMAVICMHGGTNLHKKNQSMTSRVRIAPLLMLTVLCLALAAVPASAITLYDNGPVNGQVNGWAINFGFVVSNSFNLTRQSTVQGFDFVVWSLPGDLPQRVDWSISSAANGGTVFGSGTANLSSQFFFTNQYGFNIDEETVTGLNLPLGATVQPDWLNLQNAVTQQGNPLYWDENSGVACTSIGCPSLGLREYRRLNPFGNV